MSAMTTSVDVDAGGTGPRGYEKAREEKRIDELPSNHSASYARVIDPTSRTGARAMLKAASVWLCDEERAE